MEGTILSMLDAPDLLADGVQGLRNLDTLSAHRALAKFVKETPPTEVVGPYQTALRYLGRNRRLAAIQRREDEPIRKADNGEGFLFALAKIGPV
jgi:hypothetical protein